MLIVGLAFRCLCIPPFNWVRTMEAAVKAAGEAAMPEQLWLENPPWRSLPLSTTQMLGYIQDLVKELLHTMMKGFLPVICIDKFQVRNLTNTSERTFTSSQGIFEKCQAQEHLSIQTNGGAHRLLAMLRVLQIVQQLLQQNKHASKRDIYYTDPGLLKDQATVNQALNDICIKMKCTRSSIHVVSVSKGLIMGSLRYTEAGRIVDCSVCKLRGFPVPADIKQVTNPSTSAGFIIVVEKETVFQRLANDGFCIKNNCILVTGRGYPDIATRSFLRLLVDELRLPVYGLVDADPYGLDILATYRFGSLTMAYDADALATPSIRWLGVFLSDCESHKVPERCLLPLTTRDRGKIQAMLKREYLKYFAPSWWEQLQLMFCKGVKLEIEAIAANQFSALGDEYIPTKIRNEGYL